MVKGRVDERRRAWIPLEMGDGSGRFRPVVFVVDTGFDGELTLPLEMVGQLGLTRVSSTMVTLATGARELLNTWAGYTFWHGRRRYVEILETRGSPLLGMRLLEGSQLKIQARVDGEVVVEELDGAPG